MRGSEVELEEAERKEGGRKERVRDGVRKMGRREGGCERREGGLHVL